MIYLVRHGQTEFNAARRIQGSLDSPLTALGESQARAIGALVSGLIGEGEGWEIVASPQGRARRTAELVAACGPALPFSLDERLAEVGQGAWEGLTLAEIQAGWPGVLTDRPRGEWAFAAPDGESYEVLAGRVAEWLNEALRPGRRVIAVSHGMSGRILRGLYGRLGRLETLQLEVPQDAVFRLSDGRIERIDCAEVSVG